MVKLSHLKSHAEVQAARRAASVASAAESDRLELASAVSIAVVKHRAEHHLSQTQFAALMGWKQPAVARLERGDHQPSLATLERLARAGILRVRVEQTGTFVDRQPA